MIDYRHACESRPAQIMGNLYGLADILRREGGGEIGREDAAVAEGEASADQQ